MRIKSVRLENIRSYVNAKILFPSKVVLLSGDVGSGKSSILLAIEFALFGPQRGGGELLLRKGSEGGCVELDFVIGDSNVKIQRVLKRSAGGVVQDSGLISVDGSVENLSVTELKERVLSLLNYPKEMLTKKSLVYRYTVYTPQEQMKMILLGDADLRLDTLRKVFDVDKYKRIRDNARYVVAALRLKLKEVEAKVQGFEDEKLRLEEVNSKLVNYQEGLDSLVASLEKVQQEVRSERERLKVFEEKRKEYDDIVKRLELVTQDIKNKNERLEAINSELDSLSELEEFEDVSENISLALEKKNVLEEDLRLVRDKVSVLNAKKRSCEAIKDKISSLDTCPLCKQDVGHEHKNSIINEQNVVLEGVERNLMIVDGDENRLKEELNMIEAELEGLRESDKQGEGVRLKKERREKLYEERGLVQEGLGELREQHGALGSSLDEGSVEEDLDSCLDVLLERDREVSMQKVAKEKEVEFLQKEIERLNKGIVEKASLRDKLGMYSDLKSKISGDFVKTMEEMEQKVMLSVYHGFNSLFEKWFGILVEDELINVRLDEGFCPVIEQNGHNVSYENLSGGEKTACALAYRLALNQVINTVVKNVKTSDLIILDEPTDGFSSEQLDRMRYVLDELDMEQVIIVSHESKIENFVDKVIQISKKDHISSVLS